MKFLVLYDRARLDAVMPGAPEEIEFGKTDFHLIQIGDQHVALFIVSPETLFEVDLTQFVMHSLQTIHQHIGVVLAPPVLLQLMQQIAQASVMSKGAAH